jgi:hypothetical protein
MNTFWRRCKYIFTSFKTARLENISIARYAQRLILSTLRSLQGWRCTMQKSLPANFLVAKFLNTYCSFNIINAPVHSFTLKGSYYVSSWCLWVVPSDSMLTWVGRHCVWSAYCRVHSVASAFSPGIVNISTSIVQRALLSATWTELWISWKQTENRAEDWSRHFVYSRSLQTNIS